MIRRRFVTIAFVAIVVCGSFLNQGCLRDAGGQLVEGGLQAGKEWALKALENSLPTIEAKLTALVEAKLAEQAAKYNAEFDVQLAKVAPDDPVTGGKAAKTWKDFDVDKTGILEPLEIGRIAAYIQAEGSKRVSEGKMSKEEYSDTLQTTGKIGIPAAAVGTALWYVRNRKKKKEAQAASTAAAGPDPKPPTPAAVTAGT